MSPGSEMQMAPCGVCGGFQVSSHQSPLGIHFGAIKQSARQGCPTCGILRDAASKTLDADKDKVTRAFHFNRYKGLLTFDTLDNYGGQSIVLHTLEGEEHSHWPAVKPYRLPVRDINVDDYAQRIKTFLDDCSRHDACKHVARSDYVPTRLIYVGNNSSEALLRLCETIDRGEKGLRYVALSHCWGKAQALVTTKASLDERKKKIEWEALSKTFQEAISVTRALGIDYIWIDSLCIVQDDVDDWAREASKMASVYQNAYLTIGATASSDGDQGLLPKHRPTAYQLSANVDDTQHTLCAWKMPDHDGFHFQNKSSVPLQSRAWTFQELLLSPRFVHFGREEVVYECMNGTTCECGLFGTSQPRNWHHLIRSSFLDIRPQTVQAQDVWPELVQVYSARDITYARDRLPAISSLAGRFEEKKQEGDQYLAGLWKSQLPEHLLWVAKHTLGVSDSEFSDEPTLVNPPQTWASWLRTLLLIPKAKSMPVSTLKNQGLISAPPSWSWASVECANISWEEKSRYMLAEVLDSAVYPSTIDPLGMVSGGYLTIRGQLFPLEDRWVRSESMAINEVEVPVIPSPGVKFKNGTKHYVECQLDIFDEFANSDHGTFKTKLYFLVIGKNDHDVGFLPYQGLVLSAVKKEELGASFRNISFSGRYLCRRLGLGMFKLPSNDYLGPSKAYQNWYIPETVTVV